MKKSLFLLLAFILVPLFNGCDESTEEPDAPEIPPIETMVLDFSNFNNSDEQALLPYEVNGLLKSDAEAATIKNWFSATLTVAFWQIALVLTLAVPVAAFTNSFNQTPNYLGDSKWEWSYNVSEGGVYTVRMTGEIRTNDVKWELYVSKDGVGKFDEFMWFEGTSNLDGMAGSWTLNHSADHPNPVIQIDWKKSGNEIGEIKYTWVQDEKPNGQDDPNEGAYLKYGLVDADLDAFYNVHAYSEDKHEMVDTDIEWSTTNKNGRIKAEHLYNDTEWHCWDTAGVDIVCP